MSDDPKSISQLKKFLEQNHMAYMVDDDTLRGVVIGDNGRWPWAAYSTSEDRFLVFIAHSPVFVPSGRLVAVAEYLMRANWGMTFGNFEMNWKKGDVSLRTVIALGPSGASKTAIEALIFCNGSVMERYLPGLLSVAFGNAEPENAILEAEGHFSSSAEADAIFGEIASDAATSESAESNDANHQQNGQPRPGRLGRLLPGDN